MRLFLLLGLVATAAVAEAPPAPPPADPVEAKGEAEPKIVVPPATPSAAPLPQLPDAPRIDPSLPGATSREEQPADDLDFGWMLLRTIAVLGVVIMLAWFSLNYGLRKLMGLKPVIGGASVVQVLERVPLDSKHAMFVVQAAGEYLLIGGGEGNLQLISKLAKEDVEKLRLESKKASPSLMQSPLLQRLLTRREPTPPAKTGSNG